MIIVRILGGLGNQLFMYSFARVLSLKFQVPVYIETRTGFYKDKYKRSFRLDKFNIRLKKAPLFYSFYFVIRKRT